MNDKASNTSNTARNTWKVSVLYYNKHSTRNWSYL